MKLTAKSGIWIVIAGLLFCSARLTGQELQDSLVVHHAEDSVPVQRSFDQVIVISDAEDLFSSFPLDTLSDYRKHSPAKATIMSAVLPGLGQVYNKKYWKVPIVYAAIGTSTYFFLKYQNDFEKYRRAYIDINDGDPYTNYHDVLLNKYLGATEAQKKQYVNTGKDLYRRWRDWAILAVVITYAMNVIDANVDAHLFYYSIDDDISLNIRPCFLRESMYSQKIGINLCFTF